MDAHANEYAAAVAGMTETYGRRPRNGEPAVGDTIWAKLPGTDNTHAQVVILDAFDDGSLLVKQDGIPWPREFVVTERDVMPF